MEINQKYGRNLLLGILLISSSMTLLKRSCLFATGHEDGYIKVWNLEIGSYIALETKYLF